MELLERLMYKITSGRFIFTVVAAFVYAYMSINGIIKEDRVMEILLIVVYAYFSRPRVEANGNGNGVDDVGAPPDKSGTTTTTTTLPPTK
jgi:hypothetical protein